MARPKANPNLPSTRSRIVEAAIPVFASEGYDGAKLADIAAAIDIRRPSLLYHFSTKEALYASVIAQVFASLGQRLAEARDSEGDFPTRLHTMYSAYDGYLSAHPSAARLIVRELVADAGPGRALFVERVVPLLQLVEHWIAEAGQPYLHADLPIRHALMHVSGEILLRHASVHVSAPLWGPTPTDQGWQIASRLFLKESP